jgi:hypothetical protein
VEVAIADTFKGDRRLKLVSLTVPGGCIAEQGVCFVTDIFPKFDRNEEVILFLIPNGPGTWSLSDPLLAKMKGDRSQISEIKKLPTRAGVR